MKAPVMMLVPKTSQSSRPATYSTSNLATMACTCNSSRAAVCFACFRWRRKYQEVQRRRAQWAAGGLR